MNTTARIKYDNSFKQIAIDYLKNDKAPTVAGLATLLGTDEQSVWAWANKRRKDEQGNVTDELARPGFLDVVTQIDNVKLIKQVEEKKTPAPTKPKKTVKRSPTEIGEETGVISSRVGPGHPPKFKSVDELEILIEEYFKSCWTQKVDMFGNPIYLKDKNGKATDEKVMIQTRPYTITGLAVALDTSRETLINYQQKDEFFDTIKRAKEMCHNYAEEALFVGKNPTGAIFNLKNNWGWEEKSAVDHTTKGEKIIPIMGGNSVSESNGD